MANLVGLALKEQEQKRLLKRASTDLWWLATEVCERTLLSPEFHRPMMDDMDFKRKRRAAGKYLKNEGEMWGRDYYKTTVREVQAVQDFLIDPATTATWWHAIEDKAKDAVSNVGRYFQENAFIRRLRPEMMPAKQDKRWNSGTGFKFAACKGRDPSMRGYGAGSESTGGHSHYGFLDDIIGLNDIEDSLMPKKKRWYGQTVRNVVRTGIGVIRMTGTHWDVADLYAEWRMQPRRWDIRVRACYETDGVPDWAGEPVLYTREQIEEKRDSMSKYEFSCQMMNTPLPDEERLWLAACEHFCTLQQASGPGRVFILSDEAPAQVGSVSQEKEKQRSDGSKDWWSICAVKIRANGMRQEIVLLDGKHSQDWTRSQGLKEIFSMAMRWGTNLCFLEGLDYTEEAKMVARQMGFSPYLDRDGKILTYSDNYSSGAKNRRFAELSDRARCGDFFICESVPHQFLEGDGDKTGFLTQGRAWRSVGKKNSLRYDDDADVVSRSTDSALQQYAPRIHSQRTLDNQAAWSPFRKPEQDEEWSHNGRYVRW